MAKAFDKEACEELAKKYKVLPEVCEQYNQFYNKTILPLKQEKYLSDLISVVEDLIHEKILDDAVKEIRNDTPTEETKKQKWRRYGIVLSDKPSYKEGSPNAVSLTNGAVIYYNPNDSKEDICFSIARELGNLLLEYGIISGPRTTSQAELFAHLALG